MNHMEASSFELELQQALEAQSLDALFEFLSDTQRIQHAIEMRGRYNQYITRLYNAYVHLLENFSLSQIYELLIERHYSLHMYIQMLAVLYRMKDTKRHQDVYHFVISSLDDEVIHAYAYHEQSAWETQVNHNPQEALRLNKQAIALCKKYGLLALETKIKFGLTFNKAIEETITLSRAQQMDDYINFYKTFLSLGDWYHAQRALLLYFQMQSERLIQRAMPVDEVYDQVRVLLKEYKQQDAWYLVMFAKKLASTLLYAMGKDRSARDMDLEARALETVFAYSTE